MFKETNEQENKEWNKQKPRETNNNKQKHRINKQVQQAIEKKKINKQIMKVTKKTFIKRNNKMWNKLQQTNVNNANVLPAIKCNDVWVGQWVTGSRGDILNCYLKAKRLFTTRSRQFLHKHQL